MKVVLDANVFVSAAISGRGAPRELLRRWERGEFEVITSVELLVELREVLARPKFRRYISGSDAAGLVALIHDGTSKIALPEDAAKGATSDPDDDYLVELAIRGRAEALVSGDRHLLQLGTIQDETGNALVRLLTPKNFLDELRG